MTTRFDEFSDAAEALTSDGWCTLHNLLSSAQTQALASECSALYDAHRLAPARVGLGRALASLRGDSTRWFQASELSAPQQIFIDRIDMLRTALNRHAILGLVDSEAHYAMFPAGAAYARHRDTLRGSDARVVSGVFYLNDDWQDAEGGALRLYLADQSQRDIYPRAGTLLLFLSAQFEHEVLPATRNRMSVACWMRQQSLPGSN
ncbi:MAG: 2OG-Fe(II) oxygenase [Rhodanobacter sp.]